MFLKLSEIEMKLKYKGFLSIVLYAFVVSILSREVFKFNLNM